MAFAEIFPETPARAARIIPMSLWPEEVRLHVRRRARRLAVALQRLEDLREDMIAKLDALDGDPDLEPTLGAIEHPEHMRGVPSSYFLSAFPWAQGGGGSDEQEPDPDDEPSLALAFARSAPLEHSQKHWVARTVYDPFDYDAEQEHDGREPQCEDEGAQCEDEGHDSDREPNGDEEDFTQGVEC